MVEQEDNFYVSSLDKYMTIPQLIAEIDNLKDENLNLSETIELLQRHLERALS